MLRVILTHLFLFFLPFLCYAAWVWLRNRSGRSGGWEKGPVAWLSLVGIALVIGSLVLFAAQKQRPEGAEYRPSEMRDGVFIPGHYE